MGTDFVSPETSLCDETWESCGKPLGSTRSASNVLKLLGHGVNASSLYALASSRLSIFCASILNPEVLRVSGLMQVYDTRGYVMRIMVGLIVLFLAACSESEPETFTTSANVDDQRILAMLSAMDGLADNALPVEELLELTSTTPLDQEQQLRFPVTFGGNDTDLLYHVWREQEDWVHVYASSTNRELVDAVEAQFSAFERERGD